MQYEVKIKKLPKSDMEMKVSLPADFLVPARKKVIKDYSASLEVDGFRKGHVPENVVIEKIGEDKILQEAADMVLKEHFQKIVAQEKLDILGRPKISITKLSLDNPLEFKVDFTVMPEIELPDYKKIASHSAKASRDKEEKLEATDKEIDDILLQIRKNKAHSDYHEKHPEDNSHDHAETKDEDLPVLDDEFAKTAGNFKDLSELKEKVKENIIEEKKNKNVEKKREKIVEELIKNTKMEMPEILLNSEIEKSLSQIKYSVDKAGMKWEDYLASIKKTEDDLRNDYKENSEKKAKIQLIFNKIAEVEKIEPNKEIVENETKEILKQYPDVSEQNARIYVESVLINQEVLKLLEKE